MALDRSAKMRSTSNLKKKHRLLGLKNKPDEWTFMQSSSQEGPPFTIRRLKPATDFFNCYLFFLAVFFLVFFAVFFAFFAFFAMMSSKSGSTNMHRPRIDVRLNMLTQQMPV
jgi:hypothetical protein